MAPPSPAASAAPSTRKVALTETAPGRYEASFTVDRLTAGALLLRATLNRGAVPIADASGRLAIPFAPELRPRLEGGAAAEAAGDRPAPSATLAAIAARTGGRELSEADIPTLLDPGPDRAAPCSRSEPRSC